MFFINFQATVSPGTCISFYTVTVDGYLKGLLPEKHPLKGVLKKAVLKNFAKYREKNLVSEFLESLCNIIKIETTTREFYCEFCKIFKNIIFIESFRLSAFICGT